MLSLKIIIDFFHRVSYNETIIIYILLLLLFSCSNANTEIVAEVNGDNILLSDLSEASKQELFDLLNMAYEIKSKVLDDLIKKKLQNGRRTTIRKPTTSFSIAI